MLVCPQMEARPAEQAGWESETEKSLTKAALDVENVQGIALLLHWGTPLSFSLYIFFFLSGEGVYPYISRA